MQSPFLGPRLGKIFWALKRRPLARAPGGILSWVAPIRDTPEAASSLPSHTSLRAPSSRLESGESLGTGWGAALDQEGHTLTGQSPGLF